MRISSRFAFVALLLFCLLLLYRIGRTQESWISSSSPRPLNSAKSLTGVEKAGNTFHTSTAPSALSTSISQDKEVFAPPTIEETPEGTDEGAPVGHQIPGKEITDHATSTDTSSTDVDLIDGVIVIGALQSEDTNWVSQKLPKWKHAVYVVDNQSAPLHTPMNKGREATPYLTYIIEHYHSLPKTLVFLHSHEEGYPGGWHTDAPDHSNVWSVEHLNIEFVQQTGYVNLRCTHIPGCPDEIQPFRDPYDPSRTSENHMAEAWQALFGNNDIPHVIGAACCAQFAVSRDQVLKRPLDDYIRYRSWVFDTALEDDLSGRIIEYLWHVIFGKPPVDCPAQDKCFWDVYGLETKFDEPNEQS